MGSAWDSTPVSPGAARSSAWDGTSADEALQKPAGTGNRLLDGTNAVGTGFWRGLTALAGLPVDTAANIIDLGKAGIGTAYTAATGKAPPSALELQDRRNVVGSGAWLADQATKTKAGQVMLNPVNPEYEGGYLQNTGAALSGVMAPASKADLARQALVNVLGATAGKATKDITGNDALAIAASLIPQGGAYYGAEAMKRAVRGGEQGRQQMEQRIQVLRDAGVDKPTLGLASGNEAVGGVENILQSTPGAVRVMRDARAQALAGMLRKTQESAELASGNRGTMEAGTAIQRGIEGFRDAVKQRQGQLYDNLDTWIDPQSPTPVLATKAKLAELNAPIPGAPELSKQFINSRIQSIEDAISKDTAGSPQSVMVYRRPGAGAGGLMNSPQDELVQVVIPEGPPTNALPFEAVKKTRTLVGDQMADHSLIDTVPNSKWRQLYGALTDDIGGAATSAGPQAESAFNRANNFTRAAMERLDRVAPFAQKDAPEQAFTALERSARENVSTLQAVKKVLPDDARGAVAGTIIERLGRATPGQQNANTTAWSPETFLTNWNRMTPKARDELFSGFPNAPQVRANVESVAQATAMMRSNSKLWSNPSGTATTAIAGGALGAPLLPLLTGHMPNPWVMVGVGGAAGTTNALARALTSPSVVNAMASRTEMTPGQLAAALRMLTVSGRLSNGGSAQGQEQP